MGAFSVTGISGPGISNGLWKSENNTGCGCGKGVNTPPPIPVCPPCHINITTGNLTAVRVGSTKTIGACS
jgi:hypothetical protein